MANPPIATVSNETVVIACLIVVAVLAQGRHCCRILQVLAKVKVSLSTRAMQMTYGLAMQVTVLGFVSLASFLLGMLYGRQQNIDNEEKDIEYVPSCSEGRLIYVSRKKPSAYHTDSCHYVTGPTAYWTLRKCLVCRELDKKTGSKKKSL